MPRADLVLFQNPGSGQADALRLRADIVRGLEARQVEHAFFVPRGGESLHGAVVRAAAAAVRLDVPLVAVGGDGTVNLVARAALEQTLTLGLIPSGTYNFVARSHGVPEALDEALDLLAHGTAYPIRVACLNGRRFLVNASIGLYARLLSERETFSRRFGRRRTVATLAATASALRSHRPMELAIRYRGEERHTTATTFIVGNNPFQLELVGVRDVPSDGADELAAVLLHPVGRTTLLAMIVRGRRGEVHETRELESFLFDSMDIDLPRRRARRVTVALDGELVRETLPLTLSVERRPLRLLRPARSDEAADGTADDADRARPAAGTSAA